MRPSGSPFLPALGAELERASPAVRAHLEMHEPSCVHVGALRRIWRWGGPLTWLAGKVLKLGDPRSTGQSFELRNAFAEDAEGRQVMVWNRISRAPRLTTDATGYLRWDAERETLIDATGPGGRIEVELLATVDEEGAVVMTSGRQRLRVFGLAIPIPRWLAGHAYTREWEEPDGRLGLSLTLVHPLLGEYAGYEAVLGRES